MAFGEWKSWEAKSICVEVYLHKKIKEPLCLDCQHYWDSWNSFQRGQALMTGKDEYERYVMEEAGRDAIEDGYLQRTHEELNLT